MKDNPFPFQHLYRIHGWCRPARNGVDDIIIHNSCDQVFLLWIRLSLNIVEQPGVVKLGHDLNDIRFVKSLCFLNPQPEQAVGASMEEQRVS